MRTGQAIDVSTSVDSGADSGAGSMDSGTTAGDVGEATFFVRTTFFLATVFFALFFGGGVALAFAFLRAGFAAFFATFFALAAVFALPDFFTAVFFFFAIFPLAAVRFVFTTGRFFALLFFFAMITFLLAVLRLRVLESSPEKVCCHLRMALESVTGIAYAAGVLSEDPIRPLHDVWLRPRRVFRELSSMPIARTDYLLGAAQGVVGWLALSRAQNAGATSGVTEIFGKALVIGSVAGVASLFLMGAIYARLGASEGRKATRNQVIHVLAYGGVPMVASLIVWLFTALLAGEATFEQTLRPDAEGFIALLVHAQFYTYALLTLWSVVIQVMGLSEMQGVATRKALGLWVLGQVIGFLALLFLMILIATLFPNAIMS